MSENNKPMNEADKKALNARVDELNAMALAENLAELRTHYEERLTALENEVLTIKNLVQSQSQVIGQALQGVMGRGSTVVDPTPEDKR